MARVWEQGFGEGCFYFLFLNCQELVKMRKFEIDFVFLIYKPTASLE